MLIIRVRGRMSAHRSLIQCIVPAHFNRQSGQKLEPWPAWDAACLWMIYESAGASLGHACGLSHIFHRCFRSHPQVLLIHYVKSE